MGFNSGFKGLKCPSCNADKSLPSSVDFRNEWSHTSSPPYAFIARTKTILRLQMYGFSVNH